MNGVSITWYYGVLSNIKLLMIVNSDGVMPLEEYDLRRVNLLQLVLKTDVLFSEAYCTVGVI